MKTKLQSAHIDKSDLAKRLGDYCCIERASAALLREDLHTRERPRKPVREAEAAAGRRSAMD